MLDRLSVRGLGIIDAVELDFDEGFAALTGETGAGKSLLVESLKLICGQRAQADMVRTGDTRLRVEAHFLVPPNGDSAIDVELEELGIEASTSVIIRREVSAAGRSRCWINDVSVTARALQTVTPHLLAIHGQHEQYGLADGDVQRRLVDDFGDHAPLCATTRDRFEAWREAAEELERLRRAQTTRRDRFDTITFQLQEIDGVDPQPGEDDDLRNRRLVLRHAARLEELSAALLERLSNRESAVVDDLARAEREIDEITELGVSLDGGAQRIAEARVHVEEVVREVQAIAERTHGEPGELEDVESRLHVLDQLMLKYGSSLEAVLAHRENLMAERDELSQVEERVDEAEAAAAAALADFDQIAAQLDTARERAGSAFAESVEKVLARLAMKGTRLEFQWSPRDDSASPLARGGQQVAFDAEGVNECTLLMAANPGEELRPMARIASGGELSRAHLALRTVLRRRRKAESFTLLFDEVDSGLGGAAAAALAELLYGLAAADQVLVVTHLPQVAARARTHYRVEKVTEKGRATTRVVRLDGAKREVEVARMLDGDELTETARAHARALLGAS
jgi:DNA repair protein RecN (Recombination protein N)